MKVSCFRLGFLVFLISTLDPVWGEPRLSGLDTGDRVSDGLAGELLVRELACARCHTELATRFPARQGPNLSEVGSRVSHEYLIRFLSNPHGTEMGTVMPNLLASLGAVERVDAATALAHFLSSLQTTPRDVGSEMTGSPDRGQALFESIGCAVCHGAASSDGESGDLRRLGDKYSLVGLVAFLKDPLTVRPSSRMPSLQLKHAEAVDIASYLLGESDGSFAGGAGDEVLKERGRDLFVEVGCVACHSGGSVGLNRESVSVPIRRDRLDRGCLSDGRGMHPDFSLSEQQRLLIRAALRSDEALEAKEEIELVMRQFNCVQCHRRGDYGGVAEHSDSYFQSRDPNLGEQGRLPPSLDGVGGKLKPEWLRKMVVQGAEVRPYMITRMPRFSGREIDRLLENLVAEDDVAAVPGVSFQEVNKAKSQGRELAGTSALSCLTCHTYKGRQTGAMGAIDLSVMSQRLTRSWFHHYLRKPSQFNEGTLMPEFWPGGRSALTEIYEGDAGRQIEALWLYTSDGYGMGAPRGMRREPMRLVADGAEAVMLRRSYRGIGKRGIGVGYPGDVNLVFNAEQLSLALLWRGEFLDPSGVWMSQGHGTARPLGRNPIPLSNVPEIQFLSDIEKPWPAVAGRSEVHQFRGYRLDDQRRPRFDYQVGSITVSDFFEPISDAKERANGFRRSLRFSGFSGERELVMRVAYAGGLKRVGVGLFEISDTLRIRLSEPAVGVLIDGTDGGELRVPIAFDLDSGTGTVVLDYLF